MFKSFLRSSRISERSFRNKFNSSFSDWPKKFGYLFILLLMNIVHLKLNAVSYKLKRKRKAHPQKISVQHEIFKTDIKAFQKGV